MCALVFAHLLEQDTPKISAQSVKCIGSTYTLDRSSIYSYTHTAPTHTHTHPPTHPHTHTHIHTYTLHTHIHRAQVDTYSISMEPAKAYSTLFMLQLVLVIHKTI